MASQQRFHLCTGRLVELTIERTRAERRHAYEEFNNGMVFSEKPLGLDELFTVRINKKISSWSGSIEIGLTSSNPAEAEIPNGVMSGGLWFVSGNSVTWNGVIVNEEYCKDLDSLNVGDTVGIIRNAQNQVHVFINGMNQGVAVVCDQDKVWAMINLYGKCSSISIVSDSLVQESATNSNAAADNRSFSELLFNSSSTNLTVPTEHPRNQASFLHHQSTSHDSEPLSFYSKCGSLIRLSDGGTSAIRVRHQDEFNNGVVMTSRTLKNDELFEIRINTLTDKWSGSIEMGITTHAPSLLEIPSTMTNLRSGTVMLSGCGIITNGKGTRKEYLDFHLDELKVGDYVGLMRRTQGTLHFFVNGVDQGVAANHISPLVYGVVDLYGRAVSVSIVPYHSVFERDRRNKAIVDRMLLEPHLLEERGTLNFSSSCGKHITFSSCRKTAMRQDPLEDFNHAIVLSSRALEPGEMFTVRIEDIVCKWSGSLEIGITTYSPESLNFPATMTNIRSGTWIMTATGVMINGVTVVDDYGSNMDNLKISDTLGVCRKTNGNLHFYINGVDQGLAASGVPQNAYAVIDLYGQVSKVSIVDSSEDYDENLPLSAAFISSNHLLEEFDGVTINHARAKCSVLSDDQLVVYRKNPNYFFDGCIVHVNSKLSLGQLCEFEVTKILPHWSGSLEFGVTTEASFHSFPSSLTELKDNVWFWTGRSTFENGQLVTDTLSYDTENLKQGSRIGLVLTEQGIVGYVDGVDIGILSPSIKKDVFPIINLYGKCAQVTLVGNKKRFSTTTDEKKPELSQEQLLEFSAYTVLKNNHRFYDYTNGEYVFLNDHKVVLRRTVSLSPVIFSAKALKIGETFEVLMNDTHVRRGSIAVGLISLGELSMRSVAPTIQTVEELERYKPSCFITGAGVWIDGQKVRDDYCPELYSVDYDDRIGIMLCYDETLVIFYNGKNMGKVGGGFVSNDLPHFVLHMGERVRSIEVVENAANIKEMKGPPSLSDSSSEEDFTETCDRGASGPEGICIKPAICTLFPRLCGKNVRVTEDGLLATRVGSYNQAIVITNKVLSNNILFQVKVKSLDEKWKSSLSIGVTGLDHSALRMTVDALKLNSQTWLIHDSSVFKNGVKIKEKYGPRLDIVSVSQVIGILVDAKGNLHLFIDGEDQGIAATNLPETCYGIVDLYGCCDEIEVVKEIEPKKSTECVKKSPAVEVHSCESVTGAMGSSENLCPSRELCIKYLKTLSLPPEFFTGATKCFCQTCFKYSGEPVQKQQGEPPQKFTQPVGWCKFTLHTHPNVDFTSVSKYWNLAFYGTNSALVRKLLDIGEIPTDYSPVFDLRCKKIEDDSYSKKKGFAVITPNMKFIGDEKLDGNPTFEDTVSMNSYRPTLAFQVYIQPSTFKVKSTSPPLDRSQLDSNIEKLEWIIKEPSTTILSHLLIKMDKL